MMEDEQETSFRKLIRKAGPDEPGADFTHTIMNRVQAESELDSAKEAALIQLFGSHTLVEKPSADFSRRVMSQVPVSQPRLLEPIIRPGVWYMIAAAVVFIVLLCFLALPAESTPPTPSAMDRFISGFAGTLDAVPISYPFIMFAVSILMVTDYYVRRNLNIKI